MIQALHADPGFHNIHIQHLLGFTNSDLHYRVHNKLFLDVNQNTECHSPCSSLERCIQDQLSGNAFIEWSTLSSKHCQLLDSLCELYLGVGNVVQKTVLCSIKMKSVCPSTTWSFLLKFQTVWFGCSLSIMDTNSWIKICIFTRK